MADVIMNLQIWVLKSIVFSGKSLNMDNSKSKNIRFIVGIILMVVLGTANGLVFARLIGKNLVSYHCDLDVTLREDVTVSNTNKAVNTILSSDAIFSSDKVNEDDYKVLLPAGTTGYTHLDIWYYSNLKFSDSDFSVRASFKYADNESVDVTISNNQEKLHYDNYIDINKLESPESLIAGYKNSIETYKEMWRSHQIKGAVIGLILSGVIAAIFLLIHKNAIEKKTTSILFGVLVVIDVILLLNTLILLDFFKRVL